MQRRVAYMKQIYGLYILQWRQFFIIQYPGVVYFYPPPSENTFRELFLWFNKGYIKLIFSQLSKIDGRFLSFFFTCFFKVNKGKYSTSLPYHKMFIITEKTFKLTSTSTVRLEWSWNSSKCPIFSFCRMATFPFSSIILYKFKKIFDFSPLLLSFFPSFFPSPFFSFFLPFSSLILFPSF